MHFPSSVGNLGQTHPAYPNRLGTIVDELESSDIFPAADESTKNSQEEQEFSYPGSVHDNNFKYQTINHPHAQILPNKDK